MSELGFTDGPDSYDLFTESRDPIHYPDGVTPTMRRNWATTSQDPQDDPGLDDPGLEDDDYARGCPQEDVR